MPVVINGSTGISGTDGSAATPAIQGTDTNTGIFFPAADTIAFAEGGSEVMRIDSSGNLTVTGTVTSGGAALAPVINTQTFDSSGTWTKPAGYASTSRVLVQAWGAGGSGGRHTTSTTCSGGGGGGYIERWLNLSQFGATETITIGAGGAARTGSNQAGAVGGNTTVGSLVTAYGGGGGGNASASVSGGSGGGQLSAGVTGSQSGGTVTDPGRPFIAIQDTDGTGSVAGNPRQGGGCSTLYTGDSLSALLHGGGGGCGATNVNGASSVYGGGGGGGSNTGTGGTSLFGGSGGAAGANGTNGTQPGGAGGSATGTSGAGAAGRAIITIFPA
jgi:hypothetical protein